MVLALIHSPCSTVAPLGTSATLSAWVTPPPSLEHSIALVCAALVGCKEGQSCPLPGCCSALALEEMLGWELGSPSLGKGGG